MAYLGPGSRGVSCRYKSFAYSVSNKLSVKGICITEKAHEQSESGDSEKYKSFFIHIIGLQRILKQWKWSGRIWKIFILLIYSYGETMKE